MKLSLTMIIKNESRCIERCLKAIIPYVDMVVLCDTGSTDGTLEICKAWEDRKFFHVFSIFQEGSCHENLASHDCKK